MRILLTGATGYIGKRLLSVLVNHGHHVTCCVRDRKRFNPPEALLKFIDIIEVDFLDSNSLNNIPTDIDGAYYLIHSMSSSNQYDKLEAASAKNFNKALSKTNVNQVIYLSGITNEDSLSKHLKSRRNVEHILKEGTFNLTVLRAGIIMGSGSASFEIIRDLVEKLPIMITPKWLNTKCQPIGVKDVLTILIKSLFNEKVYNKNFDIGGPNVLSYKEMLLEFSDFRELNRRIYTIPVMTPKLSSYWLYFVTSTSYSLAISLVDSMKIEVICRDNLINGILNVKPEEYKQTLKRAFAKIEGGEIVSSWKDSQVSGVKKFNVSDFMTVPEFGCFQDIRKRKILSKENVIKKIWSIGGNNGWYYANILWQIRGYIDKIFGGVGLRRGRTNSTSLEAGDALDFWRVLYANENDGRLLLIAEMKLPGEAWLEFKIVGDQLIQTATFRPHGLLGRLYWYSVLPFHGIIFNGMIREITKNISK